MLMARRRSTRSIVAKPRPAFVCATALIACSETPEPEYPEGGYGEHEDQIDMVDTDSELQGRVKALVPMSLPVKISDNDVCSLENIQALGGSGEHQDGEERKQSLGHRSNPSPASSSVGTDSISISGRSAWAR